MLDTNARKYVQSGIDNFAKISYLTKLSPNTITTIAFLIGVVGAVLTANKLYLLAICFIWISGLFDALDGTVARLTNKSSKLGAYLDLVFDRLVEAFLIIGLYFAMPEHVLSYFMFFVAVLFNFSTFLVAASLFKNNGVKSLHYDFGIIERTETFIMFTIILIFPEYTVYILNLFNIAVIITGLIRSYRVIKYEKNSNK